MRVPADEYRRIYQVMPIPCVDLLVSDPGGRILLVKRINQPAAGRWWFPGGRVFHGERRKGAALRKLREELGVSGPEPMELFTDDLLFDEPVDAPRHSITTVFHFTLPAGIELRLDGQSKEAQWRVPSAWLADDLHPFVARVIRDCGPAI